MARYVIDASAAIELAEAGYVPVTGDSLLAPTLLRSEVLALLRRSVTARERDELAARSLIARVDRLPIRLLGDRVLRKTAWRLAAELGLPDTFAAEYLALTVLHGDALVTDTPELYAGATADTTPAAFHDITSGSNGAYSAGPGWDACTGLGTPDGTALLSTLTSAG